MEITDALLNKLEQLAYLNVAPEKKEDIKESLSSVLEFAMNINELDTSGVSDNFSIDNKPTRLREDVPQKSDVFKDLIKDSPAREEDFFKVPKIIE